MKPRVIKLFLLGVFIFGLVNFAAKGQEGKFAYDSNGKRDPLMPLVDSKGNFVVTFIAKNEPAGKKDFNLEGIVCGQNKDSYAIINSNVFIVGDKIGEYSVKKIEDKKVILIKGEEEISLELKP